MVNYSGINPYWTDISAEIDELSRVYAVLRTPSSVSSVVRSGTIFCWVLVFLVVSGGFSSIISKYSIIPSLGAISVLL